MANGDSNSSKWVQIVGAVAALATIIASFVSYNELDLYKVHTIEPTTIETVERLRELSVQSSSETLSRTEVAFMASELGEIKRQLTANEEKERDKEAQAQTRLYIKLAFSVVIGGAALYVVLSNRYDKETKKWAISALTLISGVWIGSATN